MTSAVQTGAAAETRAPRRWQVSCPYLTVRCAGDLLPGSRGGFTILGFYRDAILPESAHPEDVARLADQGMVRPFEAIGG